MKRNNLGKKFITRKLTILLSLAVLVGCAGGVYLYNRSLVPELPESVIDTWDDDGVIVAEEDVPLAAAPKTTTKTTKRTTKKTVKMSRAAKKTYSKKRPTTSRKSSSSSSKTRNGVKTTTTKATTVKTAITDKYKKKSKKKVVVTKVTTTVKTTVATTKAQTKTAVPVNVVAESTPGTLDSRVSKAFTELGFKVIVDPSVSYAGHFEARYQRITLKKENNTLYHEMGHFLAFIAGNVDKSGSFVSVYNAERDKYTATNKAYVTQNSSEYFAESFKNYTENPSALKASRPRTYTAIVNALDKVTDSQISKMKSTYSRLGIWKF